MKTSIRPRVPALVPEGVVAGVRVPAIALLGAVLATACGWAGAQNPTASSSIQAVKGPPPLGDGEVHVLAGPAGFVAPVSPATNPPGPHGQAMYESAWREFNGAAPATANRPGPQPGNLLAGPVRGKVLSWCVFPSFAVQERNRYGGNALPSTNWDTPFTLKLVEPGSAQPQPIAQVAVPVGQDVGTSRWLVPPAANSPWCGMTLPGAPLPMLYLVVDGRPEAQVLWAKPAVTPPVTPPPPRPAIFGPALGPRPASGSR